MIRIDIDPGSIRVVSEQRLIPDTFLQILALATGRAVITTEPVKTIEYDDYGPIKRIEIVGDETYGLSMEASPIQSGIGVHGEEADWFFHGLPAGVEITGRCRLDMRGGRNNYVALQINTSAQLLKERLIGEFMKTFKNYQIAAGRESGPSPDGDN